MPAVDLGNKVGEGRRGAQSFDHTVEKVRKEILRDDGRGLLVGCIARDHDEGRATAEEPDCDGFRRLPAEMDVEHRRITHEPIENGRKLLFIEFDPMARAMEIAPAFVLPACPLCMPAPRTAVKPPTSTAPLRRGFFDKHEEGAIEIAGSV